MPCWRDPSSVLRARRRARVAAPGRGSWVAARAHFLPLANRPSLSFLPGVAVPMRAEAWGSHRPAAPPSCARPPPGAAARPQALSPRARLLPAAAPSSAAPPGSASTRRAASASPQPRELSAAPPRTSARAALYLRCLCLALRTCGAPGRPPSAGSS